MEYRNVFERINNVNNINEVCKNICSIYHIGNYISHKIIEIGYEDFYKLDDLGEYFYKNITV